MTAVKVSIFVSLPSDVIIELRKASVFQQYNLVLTDVSLTIEKGEFVYLIGKTGSGKSSLLRTLYADIPLLQGEGKVAGYDLKKIKRKEIPFLRRKIGIIFQDFQLLSDRSVNDNLLFVMKATGWKEKNKMQQKAQEVLGKVGLGTKGFKMPYELSGGEQQRVVIARALINSPEVILADEPTGNLDTETAQEIVGLLYEISKTGRAVVIATHDFHLFERFSGRTIRCENGKITNLSVNPQEENQTASA